MKRRVSAWITNLARTASWHRRLLAGGLAAGAVALAIHAVEQPPEPRVPIVAAARDMSGGAVLSPADVEFVHVPSDVIPDGSFADVGAVVGQRLAAPVRASEVITDVRIVSSALLAGWGEDVVAVPVRVADPGAARLVQPGDHIDLLATPMSGAGEAITVATAVPVIAVPPGDDGGPYADGSLIIVAATPEQSRALSNAAVNARISLALRQ